MFPIGPRPIFIGRFTVQQSVMARYRPRQQLRCHQLPSWNPWTTKHSYVVTWRITSSSIPRRSPRWSGWWWFRFRSIFCLLFFFGPIFLGVSWSKLTIIFSNRLKPPTTRVQESTPQKFNIDTKNGWAIFKRIRDTCSKPSFWVSMLVFRGVLKVTLPENG